LIRSIATAALTVVAVAGLFSRPSTASAQPVEGQPNSSALGHAYADVNGVRLHYVRAGRGPLMIFLHGFPEFWYEWKHQLAEFSRDHTVVAPDLRGYNLSSKPEELSAYQMPNLVQDVRALATELLASTGGSTFTLVAHDWGGVVAWVFAAQHPQALDKLVILNAPHPTIFGRELRDNPAQQQASQYMLMFRSAEAEALLSENSYAWLKRAVLGANASEVDTAAYVEAWSQPGALTGGLNYYRASGVGPAPQAGVADASPPPAAPPPLVVRVPTLVIWGEKDTALLTGNLNGLEQLVPKLTVKRIPDGTHWIAREKPAEVNTLIRDFLAQPGGSAQPPRP
jgi:pimeloyl-ACP methyl ester carboxylesterase